MPRHDPGCQCYPHVAEKDAQRQVEAVALAEYRSAALPDDVFIGTVEGLAAALHETGEYGECRFIENQDDVDAGASMVRITRDCSPEHHMDRAAAIVKALKEADPCCDCRIHVDGICKHHDRLPALKEAERE